MSIEETKRVVEAFVATRDGCWLAESVQLSSPVCVVASGRDAVREALAPLYSGSRTDANSSRTRFVVADGVAAVEVVIPGLRDHVPPDGALDGQHIGPMRAACFYDVVGGEIVRASVHVTSTRDDVTMTQGASAASLLRPDGMGSGT